MQICIQPSNLFTRVFHCDCCFILRLHNLFYFMINISIFKTCSTHEEFVYVFHSGIIGVNSLFLSSAISHFIDKIFLSIILFFFLWAWPHSLGLDAVFAAVANTWI